MSTLPFSQSDAQAITTAFSHYDFTMKQDNEAWAAITQLWYDTEDNFYAYSSAHQIAGEILYPNPKPVSKPKEKIVNGRHTYWRLHVRTGQHDEEITQPVHGYLNRLEFLNLINKWNAQQPGIYVYWQDSRQFDADMKAKGA